MKFQLKLIRTRVWSGKNDEISSVVVLLHNIIGLIQSMGTRPDIQTALHKVNIRKYHK